MYVLYFPNKYIVNLPKCVFFLAPSLNGHVILHMLHNNCETTYISNVKLLILYETATGAFPGSFPMKLGSVLCMPARPGHVHPTIMY